MAATLISYDMANGAGIQDTPNGYTDHIEAIVGNVTADGETDHNLAVAKMKWNALNAAGLPQRGDAHPFIPLLVCQSRDARPESNDASIWRVGLDYGLINESNQAPPVDNTSSPVTLTVRGGIQQVETQVEKFFPQPPPPSGTPYIERQILVGHKFDLSAGLAPGVANPAFEKLKLGDIYRGGEVVHKAIDESQIVTCVQGGTIQDDQSILSLNYSRLELASPIPRLSGWVGTVNDSRTNFGEARTQMLVQITGEYLPSIPAWRVGYEFLMNLDGFDTEIAYIDPESGNPPKDLAINPFPLPQGVTLAGYTELHGVRKIKIKREVDFADLQLTT